LFPCTKILRFPRPILLLGRTGNQAEKYQPSIVPDPRKDDQNTATINPFIWHYTALLCLSQRDGYSKIGFDGSAGALYRYPINPTSISITRRNYVSSSGHRPGADGQHL
jgi:hypothetical protein